ncbi:hypothetical protein BGZ94_005247, partial [Podila epigama]
MLHALGFTYPDIIPFHRWVGVALIAWSTIHTIFFSIFLIIEGKFMSEVAFTDKTRGSRNMPGVFSWIASMLLGLLAMARFRRAIYTVFIYTHRVTAAVFFIGLIMHCPAVMFWYYMLPGFVLFLLDRFVPKIVQARTINSLATCALNSDANIIRLQLSSFEPIKPYFPGDYVTINVPGLGHLYHPFSIASYWPEDPYSITLYIRVFESKSSWTNDLASLCGNEDKRIRVKANVDGVFGD